MTYETANERFPRVRIRCMHLCVGSASCRREFISYYRFTFNDTSHKIKNNVSHVVCYSKDKQTHTTQTYSFFA